MSQYTHTHVNLDKHNTHIHSHSKDNNTPHTHKHSHTQTKAIINRISRSIGHLEAVKKMVEEGKDCTEVLVQLAAVRAAINNTGKVILKDHIEHCIVDAVDSGDHEAIEELNKAIGQFIK